MFSSLRMPASSVAVCIITIPKFQNFHKDYKISFRIKAFFSEENEKLEEQIPTYIH